MAYLRVLDESTPVQDYCVAMDFQGAGVTVTRPSNNDSVVVTIPSAAAVAGWTDDGAIVRLTTAADNVAIGSPDIIAAEKLRVVNAAGVAIRVEGREWFVKTGVAAAAASQASSYVERFTASMWTGAAEAERDFDIYAAPRSLALSEAGSTSAALRIDYEGQPVLEIGVDTPAAPAGPVGCQFISRVTAGGSVAFDFRVRENLATGDDAIRVVDSTGDVYGGVGTILFEVRGSGNVVSASGMSMFGAANYTVQHVKIADPAGGGTVDAESRTAINAIIDVLESMGASALV